MSSCSHPSSVYGLISSSVSWEGAGAISGAGCGGCVTTSCVSTTASCCSGAGVVTGWGGLHAMRTAKSTNSIFLIVIFRHQ